MIAAFWMRRPAAAVGRLLAGIVVANAPFWILNYLIFIDRPLITYESVLACVMLMWRRWLGLPVLALAWSVDAVVSVSGTYFFTSPRALLQASAFLHDLQWPDLLDGSRLATAGLFLFTAWFLSWWLGGRKSGLAAPLLAFALLFSADALNGSAGLMLSSKRLVPANLAGSTGLQLASVLWTQGKPLPLRTLPASSTPLLQPDVLSWESQRADGGMLMVLVESLGLHRDVGIQAWLHGQLTDPLRQGSYQVTERRVAFKGNTTAAELRTLCLLADDYRSLDASTAKTCIPAQLVAAGWHTVALHGFTGNMFDRHRWWPMMGLQKILFAEQLVPADTRRCGLVFRGLCDADLLDRAIAELAQPRSFVYALTLNTHLPLPATPVPADLLPLCISANTGTAVCEMVAAHGALLSQLATRLGQLKPRPLVVIAGDHAPPYSLRAEREQFDQQSVPAYVLEPK